MSKYFIDTEFIEGTQKQNFPFNLFQKETKSTIDLISIGIVCEDNREYYAISKDFNLKEAWNRFDWKEHKSIHKEDEGKKLVQKVYWIRENVLKPVFNEMCMWDRDDDKHGYFTYMNFKYLINKYGKSNKQIAEEIKKFCRHPNNLSSEITSPEFYGYYSDYDWVVFCWLFGKMIDLPNGFPMYCIDLKQTLDEKLEGTLIREGQTLDARELVELRNLKTKKERLNWINQYSRRYPKQTNEHNALSDAKWNFELYKFINKI